jgi:hypothetical protein
VLIDIGHRLEDEGVQKIMDFMRAHESFGSLEEAADFIAGYLPYRKSFRPENLKRNLRQRADGRWIWKHGMGRRSQRQLETTGAELDWKSIMTGVAEDAAGIDVPVLVGRPTCCQVTRPRSSCGSCDTGGSKPWRRRDTSRPATTPTRPSVW